MSDTYYVRTLPNGRWQRVNATNLSRAKRAATIFARAEGVGGWGVDRCAVGRRRPGEAAIETVAIGEGRYKRQWTDTTN